MKIFFAEQSMITKIEFTVVVIAVVSVPVLGAPGNDGYKVQERFYELSCNVVNECDPMHGNCVKDGEKYSCQCNEGYKGDGYNCLPKAHSESRCDKGWTAVSDQKCVKLYKKKLTFEEAKNACRAISPFARLAEPRTAEEHEVMKSLVGKHSIAWLGGADNTFGNGEEGEFVWLSDKAPITWADWYPGEPNNGGGDGQHCLSYLHQQLDDSWCDTKHKFICQKDFECGKWPKRDGPSLKNMVRRIVKGEDAYRGQFPWQASLGMPQYVGFWAFCGGTIIAPTWILTAAHCFFDKNGNKLDSDSLSVSVGDHHVSDDHENDEYHRVKAYYIHPELYTYMTEHNDIALIELKEPIKFNNFAQPACLPTSGERPKAAHCYISGWGSLVERGRSPDVLQGVVVKIEKEKDCTRYLTTGTPKTVGWLPETLLCVSHHEDLGACHGDSGGPLACDEDGKIKVYGATKGGLACGDVDHPSLYTAASFYMSWIDQTVNQN